MIFILFLFSKINSEQFNGKNLYPGIPEGCRFLNFYRKSVILKPNNFVKSAEGHFLNNFSNKFILRLQSNSF